MQCEFEEDYSSDEDEDYQPSDEASDADSEDNEKDEEDGGLKCQGKPKKGDRQRRKQGPGVGRRRTGGFSGEEEEEAKADEEGEAEAASGPLNEELAQIAQAKKEEAAKQKADDLWSSFLEDVGQKPKAKKAPATAMSGGDSAKATTDGASTKQKAASSETNGKDPSKPGEASSASKKTVTVTKIFDFAGEEVKVTEEVPADSQEAKRLLSSTGKPSQGPGPSAAQGSNSKPQTQSFLQGAKRPSGGLSSVLNMINKKPKMSVLEKSRLDWSSFTSKEGIKDDLKQHNKGKGGYIEKQKFLQQADMRQCEKEREVRMGLGKR